MDVSNAETNVVSIAFYIGLPVKVLTAFVRNSPIAQMIKSNSRTRNMGYEGVEVPQGDPWVIVTSLYSDSGIGTRDPCVINDRAGGLGRTLNVKDFDLEGFFVQEGVLILHLSGLIGSLSVEASEFCLQLASYAKKTRTRISFDLNYRASFWKGSIFNYISDNCKNNLPLVYVKTVNDLGKTNVKNICQDLYVDEEIRNNLSTVAHLIHGSSEGRFSITYCPGKGPENLTKAEIESIGLKYADIDEVTAKYDPAKLRDGYNIMPDGEEIFYISNPALGLWAFKERFKY